VNTRLLNVATPLTAATVVVPLTPPGVDVMLIDAFELATTFPPASSTFTITAAIALPAVPFAGCVLNTSFAPAPAPIVKELLVALVSPLAAAVNV
jgi:hypothetical protein